jgi:magnesium-transporting ATPase (P-type)
MEGPGQVQGKWEGQGQGESTWEGQGGQSQGKSGETPNSNVEVSQETLNKLNAPHSREKNIQYLNSLGRIKGLSQKLGVSLSTGLTDFQVATSRDCFGTNSFPTKGFFRLFFEAFQDTTLMVLIAVAIVLLVIGIVEHGVEGWIRGGAFFIAVFLVALWQGYKDYYKELSALEKFSHEKCSVIRGCCSQIDPKDLVVGDIIFLRAGETIPADCIVCDHNVITCNESALTGESDDLNKSIFQDCFLLSSSRLTGGSLGCHAMVIGIGPHSQWWKALNTPLQLTEQIQSFLSLRQIGSTRLTPSRFIGVLALGIAIASSSKIVTTEGGVGSPAGGEVALLDKFLLS